jgi:hypothetical protein
MPINTPDILSILLVLSNINIPAKVEGTDYSNVVTGEAEHQNEAVLIQCPVPFHQWNYQKEGREDRGVPTSRYTYARALNDPWLLYYNQLDPCQMNNLIGLDEFIFIQSDLEKQLR